MVNQLIFFVTMLFWILLNLLSFTSPLRRNLSKQPPLSKLRTTKLVLLEVIAILLSLTKSGIESQYLIFLGALLLLIGWIVSNNRVLAPRHDRKWLVRLRNRVFSSIGIHRDFHYLALSGDWLQLIGLSLVLNSSYGLIFSLALFPLIVHFITISLMPPRSNTTNPHVIQPTNSFVWPGWMLVIRVAFGASVFLLFLAFLNKDFVLFNGSLENARSLLEVLVQTEATVFALVVTFLFVIIEFTNTTYTPRLSSLAFNRMSFWILIVFSATSILFKVAILSNEDWLSKFLINWALFYSITSVFSFVLFAWDIVYLMQPEVLVDEALRRFDDEWITVVKDEWASEWTLKTLYPGRDPLFVIERILVASLERGDINSFRTTLIQLREKIEFICKPSDRIALDAYLSVELSASRRSQ